MKHLFTTMAAAALAFTAGAADFNFTVDPAEGEVEMLQFITLTFPNVDEIEINSHDVTITRDGEEVPAGIDCDVENSNRLAIVLGAEQTQAASYQVIIPAGMLSGYADLTDDGYGWMEDNEEIVLSYEIRKQAGAGFDWSYISAPEEGVVESIRDIYLMFPEIAEVEVNSKSDFVLKCDGKPVDTKLTISNVDEQTFCIEPADVLSAAGTYTLEIAEYAICAYNADYTATEDLPEPIVLTWTIEGASSDVDFSFTPSLPTDEYLAYFGDVTLTFPGVTEIACAADGVTVTLNGEPAGDVEVTADANTLKVVLKNPLNFVNGEVTLSIAAGALTATDAAGNTAANPEAISVKFMMAAPVQYDLTLAITTPHPNADGEISADKSLESIFFVCEEKGLVAAEATSANVTIKEVNGDFEASGRLTKGFGVNQNYSYFVASFGKEPTYNGAYVVTVDKGAFGTADWAEDPNYGRSNDRIELKFTLVDGLDRESYTLEPESISPAAGTYNSGNEIACVTLKFAAGVEMRAGASATLAGVDTSYRLDADFVADGDGFTVTFDPAPEASGKYMLTVASGAFAAGTEASAPITVEYNISFDSGVASISAEGEGKIYDIFGMPVEATVETLPAGLYIVNGRKVMIK